MTEVLDLPRATADVGAAPARDALDAAIARATNALIAEQKGDGHWVYELEADATIPSEYILLRHFLGEPDDLVLEAKIGRYLRRIQSDAHDGWPLYHDGGFDISASVKAYYALKMIGDDVDAPHMARARAAILRAGGAEAVNVFTRIQLALFGAGDWAQVPTIPPELILAPKWFPVHLLKMSYWARTVVVPLLVLCALKPRAKNPRGVMVDELFSGTPRPLTSQAAHVHVIWKTGFEALDWALKRFEPHWPRRIRARAIERCRAWVTQRLNGVDGLGAIYPAMANSVMMYDVLGYGADHPDRAIARESVERLLVVHEDEAYCQPCVSPVWDTALAAHAMLEVGTPQAEAAASRALDWLGPRQVLDTVGDWEEQRPGVRPGGWAFQYANDYYPDLDDTAVVVMAMDRAAGMAKIGRGGKDAERIARGAEWTLGLQSKDGGFAAFDADNDAHYLNNLPFADHGALLDPPTADVSARVVSMLAQMGEPLDSPRMVAALNWLAKEQEPDGSWFGRWGVNYVYGTWSVLCALGRAGLSADHPMVARAVAWLKSVQNADGGWGESCDSYALDRTGHQAFRSTASQTAWATLGLMAVGEARSDSVARGMAWLAAHQADDGLWGQEVYTGGGFPRVFYLRYHGYPRYFPLWAMARYRNLIDSNAERIAWGM
ncbi:squalene--hopene cyclase [Novosphingobium sp. FSY-8]|uniref:Squalene--hopene cyclase n=1 Tax=Novosphingobium ovatum TaxID=1908523 RepID=A0ABW9XH72_9SPHN|nr:squalene--hopene cyclase [Novosphingobium ovatum]NBC37846.1 squalene--hopene cyclase [Novosphingobium ovatum]